MKHTAIALAILLAATGAYAGTNKDTGEVCQGSTCDTGGTGGTGGSIGDVTNRNVNNNSAAALANGGNAVQGQTLRNNVTNNLATKQRNDQQNSQSVTINEAAGVHYSGEYTVRSAPPVALSTPSATAPCYVSQGVSGSGIGFAFGVNANVYDKECEVREVVRLGLTSGDSVTRSLSNAVLQSRLLGYIEEYNEEQQAPVDTGRDRTTGLPSY